MATSSLLLVSPCDAALASLQGALLSFAGQSGRWVRRRRRLGPAPRPPQPLTPLYPCPRPHPARSRLTLTTRYYTAAIELVALPAAAYLAAAPAAALAAARPPGAPPAEALLLVLDASQPLDGAALAAASAWAAHCAEAALATLLVVSVGCEHLGAGAGAPSAAAAAHLAAAQAWALDHGFEHIEALCSQPALGAAGREKFSVPRVLEALEATLWGCAVMHAPSAARAGVQLAAGGGGGGGSSSGDAAAILDSAARLGGSGEAAEEEGEEGGEGEEGEAGPEREGYRAPELPGGAAGGVTLEGEEVEALRAAMQALLPAGAGDGGGGSGGSGSGARPAQSAAAAAAASQFEGLLGQALSIRNAAKDGSMSDAARREAASAMMEKLMAALGLEGDEDEEGEGAEGEGAQAGGAAATGQAAGAEGAGGGAGK
jgi:hypothetical protein